MPGAVPGGEHFLHADMDFVGAPFHRPKESTHYSGGLSGAAAVGSDHRGGSSGIDIVLFVFFFECICNA